MAVPVGLLGQLQRLLAQLPRAADSGVLHVLLEGVTQPSFSEPAPNTSHQFPPAVHHDQEHQGAASLLHGLLALPICLVQPQR